jgi:hypothetical protein
MTEPIKLPPVLDTELGEVSEVNVPEVKDEDILVPEPKKPEKKK